MSWIMTDWFRTEAYYASGGWRATWKGEGGGVLLNQCLHNLDVHAMAAAGCPTRVRGFCQLGRYHNIEVEDNVSAYLEYANGATGMFVSSTGEAPGTNRFEIAGTRGKVVLERDKISLHPQRCRHARVQQDRQARLCQTGSLERRNSLRKRVRTRTRSSCRISSMPSSMANR